MSNFGDTTTQTPSPRRSASRLRLHLPARLTLIGRSSTCLIENISTTGAQLIVERPPRCGEEGRLQCEDITGFFTTVWGAGNLVGVQFDEPIPLHHILELRRVNDSYSELQQLEVRRTARRWVTGELG